MGKLTNIEWWREAGERAVKTICQTIIAMVGVDAMALASVDWIPILITSALAGVMSIITSIATIPDSTEGE